MNRITKISIAVACALGMSAAVAQSVQRGGTVVSVGKATSKVAQASTPAPVQTAQAGGAAGGASTGGAAGGIGAAGSVGSTAVFVGATVGTFAGAKSTTSH